MLTRTKEFIINNEMIKAHDVVTAAVSGGADSVCLLLLLNELKSELQFELRAIHVEHGIRGEESRADARFVENLCQSLDVECVVCPVDVIGFAEKEGLGLEEAARILRYREFENHAAGTLVAVAHHQEDNAETVIFQMLRGSGPRGMSGILPISRKNEMTYIRPLLFATRSEIENELKQRKQIFVTDSTNTDVEYSRNRLRHDVFPIFTEINNRAVEHINFAARQQTVLMDYISKQVNEQLETVSIQNENQDIEIHIEKFQQLHPALQGEIILELLGRIAGRKKDLGNVHVESIMGLMSLQSGRSINLPYDIVAKNSFGKLILCKLQDNSKNKEISDDECIVISPDEITRDNIMEIELESGEKICFSRFEFNGEMAEIPKKTYTKWFDYDKIKCDFSIRKRRPGDYLLIDDWGHRKKLKQYFIDEKVPADKRAKMWLIAIESEVLCVFGKKAGRSALVSNDTKEILEIHFVEK